MILLSIRNGFQPLVRQLRVLPISARGLNLLMLGTSAAIVAALCLMAAVLRLVVAGVPPGAEDATMLVVLSGVATLTQSIQLRLRQAFSLAGILVVSGMVLASGVLAAVPATRPIATPAVVGGLAIACAAALNHRWLTRSTMTYRPTAAFKLALSD